MLASFAALVGQPEQVEKVTDTRNQLASLLGEDPVGRESLIEQAGGFAVRRGSWKFILASNGPNNSVATNTELGNDLQPQLYDLETDPGETRNLAIERPEFLNRLRRDLLPS